jgi:hypothetical protein
MSGAGSALRRRVRALEEEFYCSKAHYEAPDLAAMGRQAAAEFHGNHPEIGEEAVRAFAWCYTYDYK